MRLQIPENSIEQSAQDDEFWRAVTERDAKFDGVFVYGVASTHIFCRPICPAKRPRRENARFFATANDAQNAGFRACKRCAPQAPQNANLERVQRACKLIENAGDSSLSLAQLSHEVGVSRWHLQRTFREALGVSPKEYADALRLKTLKNGLRNGNRVLDARLDAGYNSSRALYENSASQLGMTPAAFGRGGQNMEIRFDIAPCELGFLLVAATQKGICAVTLGDSAQTLEDELRRDFPNAVVQRDEAILRAQLEATLRFLDGEEASDGLALDVRATAFQRRVWQVLQSIPRGETRSYAQLAQSIGQPTAARAVARACATNPVALLVPCHRIVRGNGAMGGYKWGIERKEKLLESERGALK